MKLASQGIQTAWGPHPEKGGLQDGVARAVEGSGVTDKPSCFMLTRTVRLLLLSPPRSRLEFPSIGRRV